MRAGGAGGWTAVALCAATWLACATAGGGWDWRALERAHPEVADLSGERLRDASPYPRLAIDGDAPAIDLVLCRWATGRTLSAALPPDADPDERALIGRALRAWEQAGLGLRFAAATEAADIEIRFVAEGEGSAWPRTAFTAADCRMDGAPEMVRARIWLDRANLDPLGRPQPLSEAELLGAALHEIGHALGFQGHAASGDSVMLRETDRVRRIGLRLLDGGSFEGASLRALYALDPGERVGRVALAATDAQMLRALRAGAERAGFGGPYARVGDTVARIFWIGPGGEEAGAWLRPWPVAADDPGDLAIRPDRTARRWLAGD